MLEPTSGSPIKCRVPLQAISIFLLSDTVSGSNPCSCSWSIFAAEIHCWATLTLAPTSSRRVAIIASWLHRSHHLHAYHRGQLSFSLSSNKLVICWFLLQWAGCCSLALALVLFSWRLWSSFEYFVSKGHLYLSALEHSILLYFPGSPAAECWGEQWPASGNVTEIHLLATLGTVWAGFFPKVLGSH